MNKSDATKKYPIDKTLAVLLAALVSALFGVEEVEEILEAGVLLGVSELPDTVSFTDST